MIVCEFFNHTRATRRQDRFNVLQHLHVRSPVVHEHSVTILNIFCSICEMALDVPICFISIAIDFIIEHLFLIFAN